MKHVYRPYFLKTANCGLEFCVTLVDLFFTQSVVGNFQVSQITIAIISAAAAKEDLVNSVNGEGANRHWTSIQLPVHIEIRFSCNQ